MITDLIADSLTRLRNAARAGRVDVSMQHSRIVESVFEILKREGYLSSVEVVEDAKSKAKKTLVAGISYDRAGKPILKSIRRVSRPGQRVYRTTPEKLEVRSGYGLQVLSTSKGLMTDKQAKEARVGGEVIAEFY